MSAVGLLDELHALGVRIDVNGEALVLRGRREAITGMLLDRLKAEKRDVVRLLYALRGAEDRAWQPIADALVGVGDELVDLERDAAGRLTIRARPRAS